jgi:hypothetical protein
MLSNSFPPMRRIFPKASYIIIFAALPKTTTIDALCICFHHHNNYLYAFGR